MGEATIQERLLLALVPYYSLVFMQIFNDLILYSFQKGYHVSDTGVGPYHPREDEVDIKAYYQWVPFMLFLQGMQ